VEHHAGELEISHVWHKHPHLIKKEKLPRQQVDLGPDLVTLCSSGPSGKKWDTIEVFWNSREQKAFTPSGSFSDSSKASPEKGKEYHDYMVKNLVKFIDWLRQYDGPIGRM